MICILDACGLIAFLKEEREKGFEAVDDLLVRAGRGEHTVYMSIINLTEVYYGFIQEHGTVKSAEVYMQAVPDLPITIVDTITASVYRGAARFKARYSMSLADAFLCATAQSLSAVIVTKDREIEAERLSVLWIA